MYERLKLDLDGVIELRLMCSARRCRDNSPWTEQFLTGRKSRNHLYRR